MNEIPSPNSSGSPRIGTPFKKRLKHPQVTGRNYKCPACGGEFDTWDMKLSQQGLRTAGLREKQCPFCGTEKGEYPTKSQDEEDEA